MDGDGGRAPEVVRPDLAHQLVPPEHAAGVVQREHKKLELLVRHQREKRGKPSTRLFTKTGCRSRIELAAANLEGRLAMTS
jgi:hypothetical protein